MRRAEVRTVLDRPDAIAAAVRPDDTDEMDTRVEDGAVVTTIERESTSGLRSTVDDYVVNLDVARRTVESAARRARASRPTDGGAAGPGGSGGRPTDPRTDDPNP